MALADSTKRSMGRSVQEGHNTKLTRRRTPQKLMSSQNQAWMSPHQDQKEKVEEKHPKSKSPPPPTTTQNPGPFQDYQNLPK